MRVGTRLRRAVDGSEVRRFQEWGVLVVSVDRVWTGHRLDLLFQPLILSMRFIQLLETLLILFLYLLDDAFQCLHSRLAS